MDVISTLIFFSQVCGIPFRDCPEAEILWEKVFLSWRILQSFGDWLMLDENKNDLSQIPDSIFFVVAACNQCLILKQLYPDLITAFYYCGAL